jgi:hypothetical protein
MPLFPHVTYTARTCVTNYQNVYIPTRRCHSAIILRQKISTQCACNVTAVRVNGIIYCIISLFHWQIRALGEVDGVTTEFERLLCFILDQVGELRCQIGKNYLLLQMQKYIAASLVCIWRAYAEAVRLYVVLLLVSSVVGILDTALSYGEGGNKSVR